MSEVKKVELKNAEKLADKFVVLWRNETKQPCRVLEVDKEKQEIRYELIGGPDKGKKVRSRYDASQTVQVYDDDTAILALLDVSC
jgi:hypothetical protein